MEDGNLTLIMQSILVYYYIINYFVVTFLYLCAMV